jgi:hypothetical protein
MKIQIVKEINPIIKFGIGDKHSVNKMAPGTAVILPLGHV